MSRSRRGSIGFPTSPLILLTLLLAFIHTVSAFAVLGVDIGTKNLKATLVKPGIPLEIVLTKDSRRKQSSAIAFKPGQSANVKELPERLYGEDALAIHARFPSDVYPNIKGLLGLPSADNEVASIYQKRYPALNLVKDSARDEIGFKSDNFGPEGDFFSVEELLGMELKVIKENAESMAGPSNPVKGVVITVPPFYTAEERRAVEVAADLAGLEIMSFVSDGLAVGLNFATSRTFPDVTKGEKPEHHLVYDMGAGSTTATLLKFQTKSVKDIGRLNKTIHEVSVISTAWDKTLGGDAMTDLVVDDLIAKFLASNGAKKLDLTEQTLRSHGKSMAKITKAAETVRSVLSANTATSSTISGLYSEDLDFTYKLNRADYESMASSLAKRATIPVTEALSKGELKMAELEAVILHGGAMRTPFVQKELESIVGDSKKLRSNVNSDEAAVFGAAFKAASQSPSFRVKDIKSLDIATYGVEMGWEHGGKVRKQNIFHSSDSVGTKKQLSFKNKEDFIITFEQIIPGALQDQVSQYPVTTSTLNNLTASVQELETKYGCKKDDVKTSLTLQLSAIDALPEVVGGTVSCESEGPIETKTAEGVVDGVKGFFGFGGKKDSSSDSSSTSEDADAAAASEEPIPSPSPKSKSSSKKKKNATEEATAPTKKTYKVNLSSTTTRKGLSHPPAGELEKMRSRLEAFDQADLGRKMRDDLFNVLEGYTYRTRDLLTDKSFVSVSTKAQRDSIETLLSTVGEWLYPEGARAGIDAIREQLSGLQKLVDPVQKRKEEAAERPELIKKMREGLEQAEKVVGVIGLRVSSASSAAASAAEEAASSATDSASSVAEEAQEGVSSVIEDADATNSASSSTITPQPSPTPESPWSMFTEDDVDSVRKSYNDVKDWFVEKLAAQNKLGDSDEPALLVSEIQSRLSILDNLGSELFNKVRRAEKSASSASSRASASASRAAKSASASAASASASASSAAADAKSSTVTASVTEETIAEASSAADPEESPAKKVEHEEL